MSADQKIEKWVRWLQIISDEVSRLVWSCDIYSETRQIVTGNPKINTSNRFYEWITRNYVHTTLMGIRRQLDNHCGTVSLENLLRDMRDNCNLLSRERHLSLYEEGMRDLGSSNFNDLAGKAVDIFPISKIDQDLQRLEQIRNSHKTYVDKRIAHYDKVKQIKVLGTFEDLDSSISDLDQLVCQYYLLIMAKHIQSLPITQYDWKAIFRQSWILDSTTASEDV